MQTAGACGSPESVAFGRSGQHLAEISITAGHGRPRLAIESVARGGGGRFEFFNFDPESPDKFEYNKTVDMLPQMGAGTLPYVYACVCVCVCLCARARVCVCSYRLVAASVHWCRHAGAPPAQSGCRVPVSTHGTDSARHTQPLHSCVLLGCNRCNIRMYPDLGGISVVPDLSGPVAVLDKTNTVLRNIQHTASAPRTTAHNADHAADGDGMHSNEECGCRP